MRVGLFHIGTENLGVEYLSSALKKNNHEVCLFWEHHPGAYVVKSSARLIDKCAKSILASNVRVIGFSVYSDNLQFISTLAAELKKRDSSLITVFGGAHVNLSPMSVIEKDFADFVLCGEAEESFPALLNELEHCRDKQQPDAARLLEIEGLYTKSNGSIVCNATYPYPRNLDDLPFSDKTLFSDQAESVLEYYFVLTGRGCPFNCSYCCNNVYNKHKKTKEIILRRRSADSVVREIMMHADKIRYVAIIDDLFMCDESWLGDFADKYRKLGIPFCCNITPSLVSETKIRLLAEAGCTSVNIGLQSGCERIRREYLCRHESNDAMYELASLLKKYRIRFSMDRILGIPFETPSDATESMRVYNKCRPDMVCSFFLAYYPGTAIVAMARKSHYLNDEDVKMIEEGCYNNPYLFGGGVRSDVNMWKRQAALYYLIALMPERMIEWLIRKKIYRLFPSSHYLNTFLYVINKLKFNPQFIIHRLKTLFR